MPVRLLLPAVFGVYCICDSLFTVDFHGPHSDHVTDWSLINRMDGVIVCCWLLMNPIWLILVIMTINVQLIVVNWIHTGVISGQQWENEFGVSWKVLWYFLLSLQQIYRPLIQPWKIFSEPQSRLVTCFFFFFQRCTINSLNEFENLYIFADNLRTVLRALSCLDSNTLPVLV